MAVEGLVLSGSFATEETAITNRLPLVRAGGLFALLVGEVTVLTLRYDSGSLAWIHGFWAQLLDNAPLLLRIGITGMIAVLFFGGAALWHTWQQAAAVPRRPWSVWVPFLCHVAVLALFAWLCGPVLEEGALATAAAPLWALAWLAAGSLTLVFWGVTLAPLAFWRAVASQHAGVLLAGAAVGVGAGVAGYGTGLLWKPLSSGTFWTVHALLRITGADVACDPPTFTLSGNGFVATIAPACSGYEGIGLVWAFLGAYLWLFRRSLRFPHALLLLPLGTAAVWMGNALRITALIAMGIRGAHNIAQGGFHSQAGWLVFNAVALGMVLLTRRLRFFRAGDADAASDANPTAPYLVPFLALVASTMVTAALSNGFDALYPVRVLVVAAALGFFWRTYRQWPWSPSWVAVLVGVAVFVLWVALEPPAGENAAVLPSRLRELPTGLAVVWLAFRVFGSSVTVPLAEELAFRGYLTRRLQAARFEEVPPGRFSWLSFLVSSVLFGLMHPGRVPAGTVAGMLYALTYYRRGRVADAVLAHGTTNALLAAYVLTTGAWSVWA